MKSLSRLQDILLLSVLILTGCTPQDNKTAASQDVESVSKVKEQSQQPEEVEEQSQQPEGSRDGEALNLGEARIPSEALQQMEVAFTGQPSRAEIEPLLNEVMSLYSTPITEENYSRAGSVLVVMRKEYGFSEIRILQQMKLIHVDGVELTFPEAAALAVVDLTTQ